MRINNIKRFISILLAALILRLVYIAAFDGNRLAKQANKQQTAELSKKLPRGVIYDTAMRKITEGSPRYNRNGLLSHVIGYTWDGGASGLEYAFNEQLTKDKPDISAAFLDAYGNTVKTGVIKGETDYRGIKLTVDYHIQKIVEEEMDAASLTGAVVVVNAKNGEIAAIASRPNFNPNLVSEYLGSDNGELVNRAFCQYNAGSIFKVVVACAALETSFAKEYSFVCFGESDIDGRKFICNEHKKHGNVTFCSGFAHSCNCMFYNIGIKTGYDAIRRYAYDFGFGEEVLRINGFTEYRGNIPKNHGITDRALANLSIGQGEILITPLQAADMLCTIVNGGVRRQLMLIKGVVGTDGQCSDIKPSEIGRVISAETSRAVMGMLRETVQYGTGKQAEILPDGAAGKTSTAESGWKKNGKTMTHGWFGGYFPYDEPEYVCVVLAEDGSFGGTSAAPVFRAIGEKILDL